jgi:hypothetical protein
LECRRSGSQIIDVEAQVMQALAAFEQCLPLGVICQWLDQLEITTPQIEVRQPNALVIDAFAVKHNQPELVAVERERLSRALDDDGNVVDGSELRAPAPPGASPI